MWGKRLSKRGAGWFGKRRRQETLCFACGKPGYHFQTTSTGYSCWSKDQLDTWKRVWDIGNDDYLFDGED